MDDKELQKVQRWYCSAVDNEVESGWRDNCRTWHDYYHGDQLTKEVMDQLTERGQPVITFNLIKPIVGLVAGQEVQRRTDIQFVGVEDSDHLTAKTLTQIYRQMGEADYFDQENSSSFNEGVIGGRGVMEVYWDGETLKREHVNWEEIYLDPTSKRPDYEDARFICRSRWVDLDVAIDMFPDKEDELNSLVVNSENNNDLDQEEDGGNYRTGVKQDDYGEAWDENKLNYIDPKRERVKLVEVWWKTEESDVGVKTGIYTDNTWLEEPKNSPYKHRQFPYVVYYGEKDRHKYPYGLVKALTSPQDVINKMISKSMHILGTKQVIAEDGAIADVNNVQENLAKADSIVTGFSAGSLTGGKVQINDNRQEAGLAFQHFETGLLMMNRVSGVNPELQGMTTNARSGTAISMRMRQGNTVLSSIYDSLARCKKKIAELSISIMAQYMTNEEIFRYVAPNGATEEIVVNQEIEDVDANGNLFTRNINKISDIFKYDIVVSEAPDTANQNEHEFTQLVELLKAVPMAATPEAIAQLVLATNLSGKELIAQSIQQQAPQQGQQPVVPIT